MAEYEEFRLPLLQSFKQRFICIEGYTSLHAFYFETVLKVLQQKQINKVYRDQLSSQSAKKDYSTSSRVEQQQAITVSPILETTKAVQKPVVEATQFCSQPLIKVATLLKNQREARQKENQIILEKIRSKPFESLTARNLDKSLEMNSSLSSVSIKETEAVVNQSFTPLKTQAKPQLLPVTQSISSSDMNPGLNIRNLNGPDSSRSLYGAFSSRIGLLAKQSLQMRQESMEGFDSERQLNSSRVNSWFTNSRNQLETIADSFRDFGEPSAQAPKPVSQITGRNVGGKEHQVKSQIQLTLAPANRLPEILEKPKRGQRPGLTSRPKRPVQKMESIRKLGLHATKHHNSIMKAFAHTSVKEELEAAQERSRLEQYRRYKETPESLLNGMEDPAFSMRNGFKDPTIVIDDSQELLDDINIEKFQEYIKLNPKMRRGLFKPMTTLAKRDAEALEENEKNQAALEKQAEKLQIFFKQPTKVVVSNRLYVDGDKTLALQHEEDSEARKRQQALQILTLFNQV